MRWIKTKQSYDKLIAILKHLGISINGTTISFNSRFKIQKIAYLSKALGVDLYYNFSLYIHGPYCHALAVDYYNDSSKIVNLETTYILTKSERLIAEKIKEKIFEHVIAKEYESELLESVSTIIYLKQENPDLSDDDIFENVKAIKPYLKEYMIIVANNIAKELLFKPEYLTDEIKKELELWDNIS